MSESYEEPTQAVTPGADPYQQTDDAGQDDARLVDPAQAAEAEFTELPEQPVADPDPVEPPD